MEKQNKLHFETRDIAISSYLISTGKVKLSGKKRHPSGEVVFKFTPLSTAKELENAYWELNAPTIQPRKLFGIQRDLKDMIFGGSI